jgi:2'-hydroxyisoflavone reductase
MFTRRRILKLGAGAFAAAQFPWLVRGETSPKKILILGGTGFLGPHVVERARERGHAVTLFNRGHSGTNLFPDVEKLLGDREKGDLSNLQGDRRWDAVIDVWANDPAIVVPMAKLLADRTDYYFFVSSIAAYADYKKIGIDETAPTRLERPGYGGNKARSEKALTDLLGQRLGIARPSAIVGPGDTSLSYHFWLSRLLPDQEIIGPGNGDDAFVELVDVRDVANWIIDCIEQKRAGIFNTHHEAMPFRSFLDQSSRGIGGKAKVIWVSGDFLRKENVRSFDHMPYWNPDRPGFEQISPAKARAAGFATRPLNESAKDAWASYQKLVAADLKYPQKQYDFEWGVSGEREKQILAAWKQSPENRRQ